MIQNLIVCGGGVKIMNFLGVVALLEERGVLDGITRFYGVSSGGILSVMLAIGYSAQEIKDFLLKFDFMKVVNDIDPSNILDEYGLSFGRNMEIVTQSVLTFKLGENNLDYTLNQLYLDKNISITLAAYSINDKRITYFDHTCKIPIWKALVASCRVPLVFTPFDIDGSKYLDGGVSDNFPIHLISDEEIKHTIGIYSQNDSVLQFDGLPNYLMSLFNLFVASNYDSLLKRYRPIMINIPTSVSFINFELDVQQKGAMFDTGYETAKRRLPEIIGYCNSSDARCTQATQTDESSFLDLGK